MQLIDARVIAPIPHLLDSTDCAPRTDGTRVPQHKISSQAGQSVKPHKMCHPSNVSSDSHVAATSKPVQFNDAPVALSSSEIFYAPPPPAKFNRRRSAECKSQNQEFRVTDANLMQQMRKGIFENIVFSELCPTESMPVQDDLWASTESAFWQ